MTVGNTLQHQLRLMPPLAATPEALAVRDRLTATEVQEVLVLGVKDQKATDLGVPAHNTVWKKLHLM